MPTVYKRTAAWRDLIAHYVYLAENANLNIAERFLSNAESSFADLSEHPFMGAPITLVSSHLAGIRKWQVKEFDDVLIFYLPRNNGVSIVRVLNAAQDWWRLLGIKN